MKEVPPFRESPKMSWGHDSTETGDQRRSVACNWVFQAARAGAVEDGFSSHSFFWDFVANDNNLSFEHEFHTSVTGQCDSPLLIEKI